MSDLIIRQGKVTDVEDMEELEQICFATPWTKEALIKDLTENNLALYIVAELEGHVIGYVGVWNIVDEGHITNVAVSPLYRRMHIASAMLEVLFNFSEEIGITSHTLEVRKSNEAAQALYSKFGFKEAGVRPGYYEDNNEDAILMWRV